MLPRACSKPVVHLELHTREIARASAFYAQVCGWWPERVETAAGAYLGIELGASLGGGIVECGTGRPAWLPYVEVEDVQAATERARLAGAAVLLEPREGPAGWRSVVSAPGAAELAFWQAKPNNSREWARLGA